MRTPYAVTFILVILLGGTYWFTQASAGCDIPISYRIGTVDSRFELSNDQARIALMEAEAVWENATGMNLFRYEDAGEFTVNFVFDERQALAEAEQNLRERLDASENVTAEIDETYAELVSRHSDRNGIYQEKVDAYERRLSDYNNEVRSYNEQGGAPPSEFERLEREKDALDREQGAINALARELNDLVADINRLSEEGNELIDRHNEQVDMYNRTFGHEREFTQGDYQNRTINIYTYNDMDELRLVLAHEFGHALGIGHVENEKSLMYYIMGEQLTDLEPTEEDLVAFDAICSTETPVERFEDMAQKLRELVNRNS